MCSDYGNVCRGRKLAAWHILRRTERRRICLFNEIYPWSHHGKQPSKTINERISLGTDRFPLSVHKSNWRAHKKSLPGHETGNQEAARPHWSRLCRARKQHGFGTSKEHGLTGTSEEHCLAQRAKRHGLALRNVMVWNSETAWFCIEKQHSLALRNIMAWNSETTWFWHSWKAWFGVVKHDGLA